MNSPALMSGPSRESGTALADFSIRPESKQEVELALRDLAVEISGAPHRNSALPVPLSLDRLAAPSSSVVKFECAGGADQIDPLSRLPFCEKLSPYFASADKVRQQPEIPGFVAHAAGDDRRMNFEPLR